MIAIRIRTKNDINGNPRRGWLIVNHKGESVTFVDEGFLGIHALLGWAGKRKVFVTDSIEVTPKVYRALRHDVEYQS